MYVATRASRPDSGGLKRNSIHFIYDDRAQVAETIARIVGERSYGSIMRNRRSLSGAVIDAAHKAEANEVTVLRDATDAEALMLRLRCAPQGTCYVHFRAHGAIVDENGLNLFLRKVGLADGVLFNSRVNPAISGFHNPSDYLAFLSMLETREDITADDFDPSAEIMLPNDMLVDLSDVGKFLTYFSGGFETRYFNRVEGDELTVVKRSPDKAKMEREYRFYGLLPEQMRHWFVQPFDFQDRGAEASYQMERLGIADMALIWIHGAIAPSEFEHFTHKILAFIEQRSMQTVDKMQAERLAHDLYVRKVRQRLAQLKEDAIFGKLDASIRMLPNYDGIEAVAAEYEALFNRYFARDKSVRPAAAIGHGDLCFSNILYDKATRIMKFIDPKGAIDKSEIWTDPFYDVAKLSHSVFGSYDIINNNLFTIEIGDGLGPSLSLNGPDCAETQSIFQEALEARGYDLYGVRLREASLFLSMLPLHKDDPRKVLGFLLRAVEIIEELRRNG